MSHYTSVLNSTCLITCIHIALLSYPVFVSVHKPTMVESVSRSDLWWWTLEENLLATLRWVIWYIHQSTRGRRGYTSPMRCYGRLVTVRSSCPAVFYETSGYQYSKVQLATSNARITRWLCYRTVNAERLLLKLRNKLLRAVILVSDMNFTWWVYMLQCHVIIPI